MVDDERDHGSSGGGEGDGALRSWAHQAAAGLTGPGAPGARQGEASPPASPGEDAGTEADSLTPAEAEAAEAEAAEAAALANAAGEAPASPQVDPTPEPQDAPGAAVPWFMPGGSVVADPGPDADEPVDADADAPVTARSWNEAELWSIPRDELDARISNILPPSRIAPAPDEVDGAEERPTAEEYLRAQVHANGPDDGAGERPRLTPATLAALVLLVVAAVSSFVFMITRGGAALPTQPPRTPAALVSQSPAAAASATLLASPTAGSSPTAARPSTTPASLGPTLPPTPVATAAPTQAPATVPPDRRLAETNPSIAYDGTWGSATGTGYAGGAVACSNTSGASATLTFTGRTITWWGPVGPTRGSATVFVDGASVGTVSAYDAAFTARFALFTRDFGAAGQHTIRIVVAGTAGHPTVAIDELVIGY